jgi:hypothetical protein
MSQPELTNEYKINEFMNGLCEYIKIKGVQDIPSGNFKTPNMQKNTGKRKDAKTIRDAERAKRFTAAAAKRAAQRADKKEQRAAERKKPT